MTLQKYLSTAALRESPNSIPVPSLVLSSHLSFCLPLLATFIVPCRIVFAMPEDLEIWPYHLSFLFFTMVRRSSSTPVALWILLQTSSFVLWSLEVSYSISSQRLGSFSRVLLSMSGSHRYKGSVRISLTLEASEMFLSLHMMFSLERAVVVWAILESRSTCKM